MKKTIEIVIKSILIIIFCISYSFFSSKYNIKNYMHSKLYITEIRRNKLLWKYIYTNKIRF